MTQCCIWAQQLVGMVCAACLDAFRVLVEVGTLTFCSSCSFSVPSSAWELFLVPLDLGWCSAKLTADRAGSGWVCNTDTVQLWEPWQGPSIPAWDCIGLIKGCVMMSSKCFLYKKWCELGCISNACCTGSKQEQLQLAYTAAEQWPPWVCEDKRIPVYACNLKKK